LLRLQTLFALIAAAFCSGGALAADDSTLMTFVDLTTGASPSAPATPTPAITTPTYIDLSNGAVPGPSPTPPPTRARTRIHVVDLANGGAPTDTDDANDAEPEPDLITITADRLADPYEEANRGRFNAHVRLHHYVIDPVERVYVAAVPDAARDGVHNVLTNLETPSVLANDLLQGNLKRAGDTLSRFVVNSTLGVFGLFDIAGRAGIPYRDDDFGATLATWGVGEGPYLLVPVIGPSNPRDLSGKVVDFVIDPFHYVTLPGGVVTSVGRSGLHEADKRQGEVGELDELTRTARDPYAAERAKAREERNKEIFGPAAPH
jgi:phospholipid-binding lipoprotein MlaA